MTQAKTEAGVAHDSALTTGPVTRSLLTFAVPMMAANVLQSLTGSINAMWVGHLVGKTGLAATSNVNLVMFMVFVLTFGFGMAVTILIGHNMGRRDIDGVRRSFGAGIGLFLFAGIVVGLLGFFESSWVLQQLNVPADVYPLALEYSRISFIGLPASLLLVFLQLALRGVGDSKTPLLSIFPSLLIDVALNPVLILGVGPAPRFGIAGSALAGVIASTVTLALLVTYIYRRDLPIRLRGPELRYILPELRLFLTIARQGMPMGLQMIVMSASSLAVMGLVNREGTSTVAAYGAATQLWNYIQMPAMGLGGAVSAMAAQNIGAGHWDRINRIAGAGVTINLAMTASLVLVVALADHLVLGLFLSDTVGAMAIAQHINTVVSWSFVVYGTMLVMAAITRANGATVAPLLIMSFALIPGRLGFAYALKPMLGPDAIWWSFPTGFVIATVLTALYYRYGGWRSLRLIKSPALS